MMEEEAEAEAEAEAAASFPTVFFDGEQETGMGNVVVYPWSNFKLLQSVVAEKIGISPHQFSIYLVDRERRGSRFPVTGKTNFSALCRSKGYVFLVVLKRSRRRERRKKNPHHHDHQHHHGMLTENNAPNRFEPPPNVMLLRRDGNNVLINAANNSNNDLFSGLELGRVGYERRVRELQVEKERYLTNMRLRSGLELDPDSGLGFEGLSLGEESVERGRDGGVVCEECLSAKEMGRDVGFHWCVYDTVTFGFRSLAGPIARPVKGAD